jgi:hypothetical protein
MPPPKPPKAVIGGPYSGVEDTPLAVDATQSKPSPGAKLTAGKIHWGDGTPDTNWAQSGFSSPKAHVYAVHGTYTITLTVSDSKGKQDASTTTATVAAMTPIPPEPPNPEPPPDQDTQRGTTVTDGTGAVWTFGAGKETLQNGAWAGAGKGTEYLWFESLLYVFGTNGMWYAWKNEAWSEQSRNDPETGLESPQPPVEPEGPEGPTEPTEPPPIVNLPPPEPWATIEVIERPSGTYTWDEFCQSSGTPAVIKEFRAAPNATITIKGGTLSRNYVRVNGKPGAGELILNDGTKNPSAPGGTGCVIFGGSYITVAYCELKGPTDFHYGYRLNGQPGDESDPADDGTALIWNRGGSMSCHLGAQGIVLSHCWAHGNYNFIGGDPNADLLIESSLVSNHFSVGTMSGGRCRWKDSAIFVVPNHGANFAAPSGGYMAFDNCLYGYSQEGPQPNDASSPGSLGVDEFHFRRTTFVQLDTPSSWLPQAYQMDGLGAIGATIQDGVRKHYTFTENVMRLSTKRVWALRESQIGFTTASRNLWWTTAAKPFRLFNDTAQEIGTFTLDEWKARTGLDTHSLLALPMFTNPPHLTDPQPIPGADGNHWGHWIAGPGTIDQKLAELRNRFKLAPNSPGFTLAADGGPVGIR